MCTMKTGYADGTPAFHFMVPDINHMSVRRVAGVGVKAGLASPARWVWEPSSGEAFYSPRVIGIYGHLLTTRNIKQFSTFPLNEWDSAGKP